MSAPLYVVDAFTDRPFAGNPAAVCWLESWPEDAWLQAVGNEMNLSETAFVVRRREGIEFELRWFTPAVEVSLCGHATLAAAHAIWDSHAYPLIPLTFHTKSGPLTATPLASGEIELDFPARPATVTDAPPGFLEALGAKALWVGSNSDDLLVEVGCEAEVRALTPDFQKLAAAKCRGVIVTARSDDARFDFVSRFFAPASGIDEDPVTGSAHCCLAEYWGPKLGKTEMLGYQASARGGIVRVSRGDDRVRLGGRAVTISRGELIVPQC